MNYHNLLRVSLLSVLITSQAWAEPVVLPRMKNVEFQPLAAEARQVGEAMEEAGSPFDEKTAEELMGAITGTNAVEGVEKIQKILDPFCLFTVEIDHESGVKVLAGPAKRELAEQGWRHFLVKVRNDAGVTVPLKIHGADEVKNGWLELMMLDGAPMQTNLNGAKLEYRMVALYSRDEGEKEAKFSFEVGSKKSEAIDLTFHCKSGQPVLFRVLDEVNRPTTAAFVIKDKLGRTYPPPAKRLAPDFAFQPQFYRMDGEKMKLAAGVYSIDFSRGPESLQERRMIVIEDQPQIFGFTVHRWIDPSSLGWWSGDHHLHATGGAHNTGAGAGVSAVAMMRQCLGEDLKVGCNLTWGPGFDVQKQFFTGKVDAVSSYPYLLRNELEVAGFGSGQSGDLCLLRLKDQIYPGGDSDQHWPTLGLTILRWAKKQGAICGPAHAGLGLAVQGDEIPNYRVPKYDGTGADEFIMDVTHRVPGPDGKPVPAVDFISMTDTSSVAELSLWYHTLNAGFRVRAAGETDFPCRSTERVGAGRTYVKLEGKLDYDAWCEGLARGASYVSDGRSHLLDFKIENQGVGEIEGEVPIEQPGVVLLTAKVAAYLPPTPEAALKTRAKDQQPCWHLERARVGETRQVPLEVIVNGVSVFTTNILADGGLREISVPVKIERSSWVALRILPSSHTNPIWVPVGGKPFAPIGRDVTWFAQGVEQCWAQKQRFIKAEEMDEAKKAYDHARDVYAGLLKAAN